MRRPARCFPTRFASRLLLLLTPAMLLTLPATPAAAGDPYKAAPMDWPHWRGPETNGISREKNLVTSWSPDGENLLWKREDLGTRSTPVALNGKLYFLARDQPGTSKEGEKVVCLDAATGETLWENVFNVFLSDVPDTRVGWSCVTGDTETGDVYALGVCDYFQCIDGETGETKWSHSLSEEYGMLSTYGGRTNMPLIQGDLVIISGIVIGWGEMAKPAHRFIAFDRRNGQPVWFEQTRLLPYDTTYSSPIPAVINGQEVIVFGSGDGGIHALQPQTGQNVWTYNVSRRGINTTPVVADGLVIAGHSEENIDSTQMGALFAIDATKQGDITKTGEVWRTKEAFVGKSAPLYIDGRIYACEDSGTLLIVEAKTGKQIAVQKLGGPMRSSPIYADGKIYLITENGRWWVLEPTEDGVKTVNRARMRIGESHGSPIVSHGRMVIPTSQAIYCIGNKDAEPAADPRPERPAPTPVADDQVPAHVQIVPVESLLRPGDRQQFSVRLYNASGQFLRTEKAAKLSIDGPGSIDKAGKYSTPSGMTAPAPVYVTAKVGELKGTARIRVVPELPWSFTFDDGQVPVTWVGARYRHIGLDYDFYTSLKKQNPQAAGMYIELHTAFTNSGLPKVAFDDTNPRRRLWTGLLIYFGLDSGDDKPQTVEQARETFGASLDLLKEQKYLASWEIGDDGKGGIRLTAVRGERNEVGNGVITKIRTIPLGTKSQGWMGHTGFRNYTIEADVMGLAPYGKMPDMGLIAQRYTVDLRGAKQELQVRTWPPQLRMAKQVPTEWKPETWYRLKLQASVEDGKAVLRAKVWPRDGEEPAEWQVEAIDEQPNTIGSPGLFGNARDGEIFYDNLKVYGN